MMSKEKALNEASVSRFGGFGRSLVYMLVIIPLLVCAGCNTYDDVLRKILPKEEHNVSVQFFDLFRVGNINQAEEYLDEEFIDSTSFRRDIAPYSKNFAEGGEYQIKPIGYETIANEKGSFHEISYEVKSGDKWFYITSILKETGEAPKIAGIGFKQLPSSLEEIHKVRLDEVHPIQFMTFLIYVGYLIVTVVSFFMALFTKILRFRWLWAVVTLLGICSLTFNWTSQTLSIKPSNIGFSLVVPYDYPAYLPLTFTFYIPIGVIIFHFARFNAIKKAKIKENNIK